jgi:hypothetical protein
MPTELSANLRQQDAASRTQIDELDVDGATICDPTSRYGIPQVGPQNPIDKPR